MVRLHFRTVANRLEKSESTGRRTTQGAAAAVPGMDDS